MPDCPKILLLDDDQDLLELYRDILQRLPEHPEIRTATSAARAIAMLDADPFDLLITDIVMPKMDGIQLLTIVRQRWPQLRTVIVTAVPGDQLMRRSRDAGVDLFFIKPTTSAEVDTFLSGVSGLLHGKAVDSALTSDRPPQPSSPAPPPPSVPPPPSLPSVVSAPQGPAERPPPAAQPASPLASFCRLEGVEFALAIRGGVSQPAIESWRAERPEDLSKWLRSTLQGFKAVAEPLQAGALLQVEASGPKIRFTMVPGPAADLCIGFRPSLPPEQARATLKLILSRWTP